MSRIGNMPINLPENVTAEIAQDNTITVKGPNGELKQQVDPDIKVEVKENDILVTRPTDQKRHKSMHGLYRSLLNNMVIGVSEGFTLKQELVGVGYRANLKGNVLELGLGYSHEIHIMLPKEIKVEVKAEKRKNPIITLKSADKQLLGQVAAKIRSLRPPEPYKGKGVKFVGEYIRKKAGKSASV